MSDEVMTYVTVGGGAASAPIGIEALVLGCPGSVRVVFHRHLL